MSRPLASGKRPHALVACAITFAAGVIGWLCLDGVANVESAAGGARNPHYGIGIGSVENNPIRSRRHFLGERIVLDRATRMRWFITGFNLEGVHYDRNGVRAPREIRSSSWTKPNQPTPRWRRSWSPGSGRVGYANGDGGTVWFRLARSKPDGTPDLSRLVAQERINAVQAYERSKSEFRTGLTQLIGFKVGKTVAPGEYVAVFGNASRKPSVNYFSLNFPTFDGGAPNSRNERNPNARGALGGLDPRETIMWSTTHGRSWRFGSEVGGGARYRGYYRAGRNRRIPWFGWQEAQGEDAKYQQPLHSYGRPMARPRLSIEADRDATLTRAGGFATRSASVGIVTVTTAAGEASTTRRLGPGLSSAPLTRALPVKAGETYVITATGAAQLARADSFVRATFGALPRSMVSPDGTRAQLFAE